MFPLFDPIVGYGLLAAYAAISFAGVYLFSRGYNNDKPSFLLARRELNFASGALSIAAAWLWAPGLFISAQQAYMNGIAGLFWFCLGNFLTLMFFAGYAYKLRIQSPEGFTISGFIQENYGGSAHRIYQVEMLALTVCAFAINLIAGGTTVAILTGMSYNIAIGIMTLIALSYVLLNGLKATVVTEIIKIGVVWTTVIGILALFLSHPDMGAGITPRFDGVGDGDGSSIIGSFGWGVFTSFGIAAFLGHLAGPWRDNNFYQRAFAIKKNHIIPAFILAACIFICIPLAMGYVGFIGAGSGVEVASDDVFNVNIITIGTLLPSWVAALFTFAIMAGLVSIIDSQLSSISNIIGNDFSTPETSIKNARHGMVALACLGLAVAMYKVSMGDIFLFFSIMGTCLFIPTLTAIARPGLYSGNGLFVGIGLGFICAMPFYAVGSIFYASLTALIAPPAIGMLISRR